MIDENSNPLDLVSAYEAATIYNNFDEFVERNKKKRLLRRGDHLPVYALVRLARNNYVASKRVFTWAVQETFLHLLQRNRWTKTRTLSRLGYEQCVLAASSFGQNPEHALVMLESVFVLEQLAPWAEDQLRVSRLGLTLDELRQRTGYDDEDSARQAWLDDLFSAATIQAERAAEEYARVRDVCIMLGITGLADGSPPTRDEIDSVISGKLPTRHSASQQRVTVRDAPRRVSDERAMTEWVLGSRDWRYSF